MKINVAMVCFLPRELLRAMTLLENSLGLGLSLSMLLRTMILLTVPALAMGLLLQMRFSRWLQKLNW